MVPYSKGFYRNQGYLIIKIPHTVSNQKLTLGVQRCVQTDKVFALLRAIKAQCCPSLQIMTLNTQGPGVERLQNVAIGGRRKELRKKSL